MPRKTSAGQTPLVHADSELLGTLDTHSSDLIHSGSVYRTKNEHARTKRNKGTKTKKNIRRPSLEVWASVSEESTMTHHETCHPAAEAS